MNYELTASLSFIVTYIAYFTGAVLVILLLIALAGKKWELVKRILKYTLNSSVFIISWMFILELALVVRPAMYNTKEETFVALTSWIRKHQVTDAYVAVAVIVILFMINLFFYFKVENRQHKKDLYILAVIDLLVLFAGIWLTGQLAYFGLMQEVNRHFG